MRNTSQQPSQILIMMLYPQIGKVQICNCVINTPKMDPSQTEEHPNNFGTVPRLRFFLVLQLFQHQLPPHQLEAQSTVPLLFSSNQTQVGFLTHAALGIAIFANNQIIAGATNQNLIAKTHVVAFTAIHTINHHLVPLGQIQMLPLLFLPLLHPQLIFQRQGFHAALLILRIV